MVQIEHDYNKIELLTKSKITELLPNNHLNGKE